MQASVTDANLAGKLRRTEDYLVSDPNNAELLAIAIDLSMATDDLAGATRHAEHAHAAHPENGALRYRHAQVLAASGKWDEAAGAFAAMLEMNPHVNLATCLAGCDMHLGRYGAVLETLAPYREDATLPIEAATLMVRALHHLGQYSAAADLIEATQARLTVDAPFCGAASLLYLDFGKTVLAEAMAARALEDGSPPLDALVTLGSIALERLETAPARVRFNQVLTSNPRDGRSWSGLGVASMLERDMHGGKGHFEQAVNFMPEHIGSWHGLGWCRLLSEDLSGAEQAFAAALALDRNFGESHGAVAVVAAYRGQHLAAEQSIRTALRLDPDCLTAHYAQTVLRGQANDPARFKDIALRLISTRMTAGGERLSDVVARMTQS